MDIKAKIPYILIVAAVLVYAWNVFAYSLNIPILDDYDAVFGGLLKFTGATSLRDIYQVFFVQHNEHRVVVPKLFIVADYYIGGAANFRVLTFLGNLGLLGLVIVLFRLIGREKDRAAFYAVALLVILQPQHWENMIWAMSALPNFYVLFLASLSFYVLTTKQSGAGLAAAIVSAVLSVFTFANGLAVFPVGLILLVAQRRGRDAAIWAVCGAVIIAFYFHGFVKPGHHPPIVATVLSNPYNFLLYFFSYVGSSVFFAPALGGLVLSGVFIYLLAKGHYRKNPALMLILFFLFVTAFLTSLARSGFGVEQALSSRYKTGTALILALSAIALMEQAGERARRFIVPAFLVAAVLFNAASYYAYHGVIRNLNAELRAGMDLWKAGMGKGLVYNDYNAADRLLRESLKRGIYVLPEYPSPVGRDDRRGRR